jgi:hypothetical protein
VTSKTRGSRFTTASVITTDLASYIADQPSQDFLEYLLCLQLFRQQILAGNVRVINDLLSSDTTVPSSAIVSTASTVPNVGTETIAAVVSTATTVPCVGTEAIAAVVSTATTVPSVGTETIAAVVSTATTVPNVGTVTNDGTVSVNTEYVRNDKFNNNVLFEKVPKSRGRPASAKMKSCFGYQI